VEALADALGRVAGDQALRSSLEESGRRRAGDYSWTSTARRMWDLYGRL
jgi:glycosyltransferase involved in cell wall biosynthesis